MANVKHFTKSGGAQHHFKKSVNTIKMSKVDQKTPNVSENSVFAKDVNSNGSHIDNLCLSECVVIAPSQQQSRQARSTW